MNEQNKQRLGRMTKRHMTRLAQGSGEAESDAAFLAEFCRVRHEVLHPVMEEVGAQLRAAGYDFKVVSGDAGSSPAIDFHIAIPGRGDSKDTIRFFAHKDSLRGWQVVAEIELKRSPMELARFDAGDPITHDIAEQLLVDATEQMFASALTSKRRELGTDVASPTPARRAADAASREREPSAPVHGASGVRADVLDRLRTTRRFDGLDLVGVNLDGLDLIGVDLSSVDLRGASLRGCRLLGARLMAAVLAGADLSDANLVGADLTGADLSDAVLDRARLDGAVLDGATGLPGEPPMGERAVGPEPSSVREPVHHEVAPFESPPELALPPLADAPEARWARWASGREVVETAEVNVAALRHVPLPFVEGPPAPEFFAEADAARARAQASEKRSDPGVDATMPLPVMSIPAADGAGSNAATVALPVISLPAAVDEGTAERAKSDPPALTVEQYAALCAEVASFPGKAESTFEKYGLTSPRARADLDEDFAHRFRSDPGLHRRWQALVAHYNDWYRRYGAR